MAKQSKQSKKAGRNIIDCKIYKDSNRREHNKLARLRKHLAKVPEDVIALEAVKKCQIAIRGFADKS
jgi:hypothetical protein